MCRALIRDVCEGETPCASKHFSCGESVMFGDIHCLWTYEQPNEVETTWLFAAAGKVTRLHIACSVLFLFLSFKSHFQSSTLWHSIVWWFFEQCRMYAKPVEFQIYRWTDNRLLFDHYNLEPGAPTPFSNNGATDTSNWKTQTAPLQNIAPAAKSRLQFLKTRRKLWAGHAKRKTKAKSVPKPEK